jgi:hypothetical protein
MFNSSENVTVNFCCPSTFTDETVGAVVSVITEYATEPEYKLIALPA